MWQLFSTVYIFLSPNEFVPKKQTETSKQDSILNDTDNRKKAEH